MAEKVKLEEMKTIIEKKCYNLTLAGYAPYDADPEVAFSVVVPWVNDDKSGINSAIGKEILDAYFELKAKREVEIQSQSSRTRPSKIVSLHGDIWCSDIF